MKRYENISDEANKNIENVHLLFKEIEEEYMLMITDATLEETKLIGLEFIECLNLTLSKCVIKKKYNLK